MDLLPTAMQTLCCPFRSGQPEHPISAVCFSYSLHLFFSKQGERATRGTIITALSVQLNWVYFTLTNTLRCCIELFSDPCPYIPILLIRTIVSPLKKRKRNNLSKWFAVILEHSLLLIKSEVMLIQEGVRSLFQQAFFNGYAINAERRKLFF